MNKRFVATVFAVCSTFSFAQNARDFALRANIIDGMNGLTIVGYLGSERNVIIPPEIDGIPVTSIGDQAFMGRGIAYVSIPPSVIIIGKQAFLGNRLTQVFLPSGVRLVGDGAFDENPALTIRQSTMPRGVNIQPSDSVSSKNGARSGTYTETVVVQPDLTGDGTVSTTVREFVVAPPPEVKGRITVIEKQHVQLPWQTNDVKYDPVPLSGNTPSPSIYRSPPVETVFVDTNRRSSAQSYETNYTQTGNNAVRTRAPDEELDESGVYEDEVPDSGYNYEQLKNPGRAVVIERSTSTKIGPRVPHQFDMGAVYPPYVQEMTTKVPPPDNGTYFVSDNGNGTATITGYQGRSDYVSVPISIKGLTPTIIGHNAFSDRRLLEAYIPNTITHIGDAAFAANTILTVAIPESVRYIGYQAFSGNALQQITIGANVNIQSDSVHSRFAEYYNTVGKLAGSYIYRDGVWSYLNLDSVHYSVKN